LKVKDPKQKCSTGCLRGDYINTHKFTGSLTRFFTGVEKLKGPFNIKLGAMRNASNLNNYIDRSAFF
jgi:hypothetical protein